MAGRSRLRVVMEPTDLSLELGCNGVINADVIFHGKAAHSARPWLGENAITKAGEWLATLHARQPKLVEMHGLEYREVFSVTKASGGVANNVLPAEFTVNLNYRFPPTYTIDQAEDRLRALAEPADLVEVTDRAPAGTIPEGNLHLRRLEGLVGGDITAKQGWTDVARLTAPWHPRRQLRARRGRPGPPGRRVGDHGKPRSRLRRPASVPAHLTNRRRRSRWLRRRRCSSVTWVTDGRLGRSSAGWRYRSAAPRRAGCR